MKKVVLLRTNPVSPDPPVEKMASALIEAGFDVTVLAWDRDDKYNLKKDTIKFSLGSAKIIRFGIPAKYSGGFKNLKALGLFQLKIFSWLLSNRKEYDILHPFDLDTGLASFIVSKLYKKKMVYHILDEYADSHYRKQGGIASVIKKVEHMVINRAQATVICTEKREEQIKGSLPKRLFVIHNSPEKIALKSEENAICKSSSERVKIVYVGVLLDARFILEMIEIVKEDERFEMHIGGYGLLEKEVKQAASECDRIYFYGRMKYSDTLALEDSCDVMTAIYDPKELNHRYAAPNKLYESMMLGKPVIMIKNTGWDEVIKKNNIGVIADFNKESIKEALGVIIDGKEQWSKMAERAKSLYGEQYSWDIMKKRIYEIYESL